MTLGRCRGEDLFGYRAHLLNWLTEETTYPVLFVRYEAMFDPDVALVGCGGAVPGARGGGGREGARGIVRKGG